MRIFVAGATGVLGIRVIPLLFSMGHIVAGMTRTQMKTGLLSELGAEPVLCDVYDINRLKASVANFRPDLIIDLLTDLPDNTDDVPAYADANNRMRKEGTENLTEAAAFTGHPRILAQSVAWKLPGMGDEAVRYLERVVTDYGGTVLRYGQLYGPGTFYRDHKPHWPRIHIDHAACMTVKYLDVKGGTIQITEEEDK